MGIAIAADSTAIPANGTHAKGEDVQKRTAHGLHDSETEDGQGSRTLPQHAVLHCTPPALLKSSDTGDVDSPCWAAV